MKIIEILSSFGLDLTIIDIQERNCLHYAIFKDFIEIVN